MALPPRERFSAIAVLRRRLGIASAFATFRTPHDVRLESVMHIEAEVVIADGFMSSRSWYGLEF